MLRKTKQQAEDGFTLVEVLVALAVISAVLLGLVYVQLGALKTTTLAKQRQQATGLANRTMETLRSLPFAELLNGMALSDLPGDSNIAGMRFRPSFDPSIDEEIHASSAAPLSPLRPHVQQGQLTSVGNLDYTVRTYVTKAGADVNRDGVMLTVAVNWSSFVSNGEKVSVVRSRAYSPDGCTSTSVRAFSGPCQTFLHGQAGSRDAVLQVEASTDGAPVLEGTDAVRGAIALASSSSVIQAEQIISGSASGSTSGTTVDAVGATTTTGSQAALSTASTDPSSGPTSSGLATVTQLAGAGAISGTVAKLTLRQGSSDTARGISVPSAEFADDCQDINDMATETQQVCSSSRSSQPDGAALALDLVKVGDRDLPSVDLMSIATASSRGWAARFVASGATHCVGASAAGCVAASAQRTVGDVTFGQIPTPNATDTLSSTEFSGLLARTTGGYADSAVAESGAGATTPPDRGQRSDFTLEWWNGGGYEQALITRDTTQNFTIPEVTVVYRASGNPALSITASGQVQVSAASAVPSGPLGCQTEACTWSIDSGAVTASIRYVIRDGEGTLLADFSTYMDLGSAIANTSYRAAP